MFGSRRFPMKWEQKDRTLSGREDRTPIGGAFSNDGVAPLVLDLSPSSSSLRAAKPLASKNASEPADPRSSKAVPPNVAAQALPAVAERVHMREALVSDTSRHAVAVALEEPRLEDLDAGFDALLEESDRNA